MHSSGELLVHSRECINFVSTVHTLFYILHNGPIHDDNKTSYIDSVSRYLCRGSADDVTIY